MAELLLATEDGKLQIYDVDKDESRVIFTNDTGEGNMGTYITDEHVYVACNSKVYKLDRKDWSVVKQTKRYAGHSFHQINVYGDIIYLTVTQYNQIWLLNLDLKIVKKITVKPPLNKPIQYKHNYNHINNIVKEGDKFYVDLNWLSHIQYGMSGVCVYDLDFNEIERFEYGWESHEFQFIENDMICVCGSSGQDKKINHPKMGGIMINNEMVFKHDPDEAFCKGLAWDDKYFYLCGGEKRLSGDRKNGGGIIYIIDKNNYSLVKKIMNPNIKNIKSVFNAKK